LNQNWASQPFQQWNELNQHLQPRLPGAFRLQQNLYQGQYCHIGQILDIHPLRQVRSVPYTERARELAQLGSQRVGSDRPTPRGPASCSIGRLTATELRRSTAPQDPYARRLMTGHRYVSVELGPWAECMPCTVAAGELPAASPPDVPAAALLECVPEREGLKRTPWLAHLECAALCSILVDQDIPCEDVLGVLEDIEYLSRVESANSQPTLIGTSRPGSGRS
jgi:hypothetical protein